MTTRSDPHMLKIGKKYSLYGVHCSTKNAIKLPHEDFEKILVGCESANPFQLKLLATLFQYVTDDNFDVARCAKQMRVHRSTLFKNIKELYGVSPNIFIQRCRLEIAKHMLPTYEGTVSQLAIAVGFDSPSYFTRCFKQYYRMKPSDLHQ